MCIQLSYYFLFGCTTDSVKYQAQPQIIYTSTKSEESFLSALQRSGMLSLVMTYELSTCVLPTLHLDADGTTEAPTVKLVKSSIFSYEQAWHRY